MNPVLAARHARAREALHEALAGLSWAAAHDTPSPKEIVAACRQALSPAAAEALDELLTPERETVLSWVRAALDGPPSMLVSIERHLVPPPPSEREPKPGFVPCLHWCPCGAHPVARRRDPCPERPLTR